MANNNPYQQNKNSNRVVSDEFLAIVDQSKRREYLLKLLKYPKDTVISIKQLEDEFNAIKDTIGL